MAMASAGERQFERRTAALQRDEREIKTRESGCKTTITNLARSNGRGQLKFFKNEQ
jgi:hypothetical protein